MGSSWHRVLTVSERCACVCQVLGLSSLLLRIHLLPCSRLSEPLFIALDLALKSAAAFGT